MIERHCIYCDNILNDSDIKCRICGAAISDETCFKKRFNFKPLLKGLATAITLRLIFEIFFSFMPFKTLTAVFLGCAYMGYLTKRLSLLSVAVGGLTGIFCVLLTSLFLVLNTGELALGFLAGAAGVAAGNLIKKNSDSA